MRNLINNPFAKYSAEEELDIIIGRIDKFDL
jgi:hypothetical protein